MAITGIPNYTGSLPVEFSMRCACARRYLVFTGAKIVGDARARAEERATELKAIFIDVRLTPFVSCECGELLDFTNEESMSVH